MSGQMPESQWSMDSAAAKWRNWNQSNLLLAYFGPNGVTDMGNSGETEFKAQLYRSMISQALFLKTEIEAWRADNVWGTVHIRCFRVMIVPSRLTT